MSNLYDRIEGLCKKAGINVTMMCRNAGVSRGNLTDLKMGRQFGLSAKNANKIATYFGVSVGYLLGTEDEGKKIEPSGKAEGQDVTFDDFTYALHDETKELTEENKQKLLEMARFFKEQQDKKKKE